MNQNAIHASNSIKVKFVSPITTGKPMLRKDAQILAFDKLTAENSLVDLARIIDFGDAPILDLGFKRNFKGKDGEVVEDFPITPVSAPDSKQAWKGINDDYDYFEQYEDYALVYKNSIKQGKRSAWIKFYQGAYEAAHKL